ncbi:MAG: restriction endonuclease [Anaerolineales bacterium]|nr:MAG: restriction endonuclease [Anaerolineales bacterium]
MSIARHHNEWLSLVEVSGPFLSLPVLMRVFPQGLDASDRDGLAELRLAYEEWLDDQNSLRPSTAIHTVWVRYVLGQVLGIDKANLLEGPAVPANLKAFIAEQGETLHPDLVVADNAPSSKPRMLVQIHPFNQGLEKTTHDHRWKASPAMRMLELLRATGVSLGLVTNGEQWMLVHAPKGETSAFISWYAALWLEEPLTLRAFTSLLGAPRFFSAADEDTLEGMLKDSVNEQQEVTDQLGYQVRRAVEVLIRAVDKADQDSGRKLVQNISDARLYEAALTVMMRLVFLFSAEERDLLLLGDPIYDQNYAVSTLRAQLRETADQLGEEVLERRFDAWCRLLATFRAVHDGIHHDRLTLPAYGGSLFDPDHYPFLEGRSSAADDNHGIVLPISNRTVLHLLEALQVLRVKVPGGGPAEARRLSFRSLDVEQIGHVYEGLLDHIAVRATEPVLGLSGTRDKEPEIPLSVLLAEEAKGEKNFLAYLKEQTGRSENALRNLLHETPEVFASQRLMIACNNDQGIYDRVVRYAGLIREDDFGYPVVFLPGGVYVTAGATRRATGTHYTPRSLTEPIVQHTLEPLVYIGPAEGLPREEWKLHSAAEILSLKVCDMAMGSAGFLVQVDRYLAERLTEAWAIACEGGIQITPEGKPSKGGLGEKIIPKDDDERMILARRLVADRCIYGVDKNPLAVEIAKLSIWLTTMDRGRPFTFLDHALKCGDSLVGASADDYLRWAHGWREPAATLFDAQLESDLETARKKRLLLEQFEVVDVRDIEHKAELLLEADAAMAHIKRGCDLLMGARLLGLSDREIEELQLSLLFPYMAGELDGEVNAGKRPDAARTLAIAKKERVFHWEFEFPEVFERGGFSAFIGNPPFLGGTRISTELGTNYLIGLKSLYPTFGNRADLCSLFFLSSFEKMRIKGCMGLIATNTISQGDSRVTGLDAIVNKGGDIYTAISSIPWVGTASVFVSVIHITKQQFSGKKYLNNSEVEQISPKLDSDIFGGDPKTLSENDSKCFTGSKLDGIGFAVGIDEAKELIKNDPQNQDVLFPYLNGDDLNSSPDQSPTRWVIYFRDWSLSEAERYPLCLQIVRERVYPERQHHKEKRTKENWWLFQRTRPELYRTISSLKRVLIIAQTSKTVAFSFVPVDWIYNQKIVLFAYDDANKFAVMQSAFHNAWVWKYSSTLGEGLSYAPTDCFQNFPFPKNNIITLDEIGETYHEHRRKIMLARMEGLTPTYNRFHNPKESAEDIVRLRELHVEMDQAVASAYGWGDLDLGHGFHETAQGVRFTISEAARREVLARLLKLNHERYEEEIKAGLHEEKKAKEKGKKGGKKVAEEKGQYELF